MCDKSFWRYDQSEQVCVVPFAKYLYTGSADTIVIPQIEAVHAYCAVYHATLRFKKNLEYALVAHKIRELESSVLICIVLKVLSSLP